MSEPTIHEVSKELTRLGEQMNTNQAKYEGALDRLRANMAQKDTAFERLRADIAQKDSAFERLRTDMAKRDAEGVGLTCQALARCNLAILSLFRSCFRAFDEVLLTILLSLAGFCQRDGRSACGAFARRFGWKGCSRAQNAAR